MTIATLDMRSRTASLKAGSNGRRRSPSGSATRKADPAMDVAVLAHDVRGPLANLVLLLEAIDANCERGNAHEVSKRVDRAMTIIERLDAMLSSCVQRSRKQDDPAAIEPWPVSLPDLVEQVAALNGALASEHRVRVHVYSADPLVVQGDGHLLMQAIDNIVVNAIKHAPRGGLVTIQTMPEGGRAVIRVDDNGPGFTKRDVEKAFQPFRRLSARSDSHLPSTGLGLSIVKSIVSKHGGKVSIARAAKTGGGSVRIALPLT